MVGCSPEPRAGPRLTRCNSRTSHRDICLLGDHDNRRTLRKTEIAEYCPTSEYYDACIGCSDTLSVCNTAYTYRRRAPFSIRG